jgi:hypothetical protein
MVSSRPRPEHATAPVWLRLQPSRVLAYICHTDRREVPRLLRWVRVFLRSPLITREVRNGSGEIHPSTLHPRGGVFPGLGFFLQVVLDVLGQVCLGIEPEEHPVAALLLQGGHPLQEQLLRDFRICRGPLLVRRDEGNKAAAQVTQVGVRPVFPALVSPVDPRFS